MLKKMFRNTIITLIQGIVLVVLVNLAGNYLLDTPERAQRWQNFLNHSKHSFLMLHGLFYIALYFAWPYVVRTLFFKRIQKAEASSIEKAIQARVYLIAIFILFEILFYMRSL